MKTITINSIKGGTGKSTLSVLIINALVMAGFRCLVIDADASNNSLSYYLNDREPQAHEQIKTIFNLFMGETAGNCVIRIKAGLDLICGDVRLNEFRSTDSLKKLKRALAGLDYDFCVIDTSPTYDNIIGNVLTASDVLLIPVQQDIFSYQALQYQFEKPLNDNQGTYRNQITNMFLENEVFKPFINPNRISRSSVYRKYINKRNYRLADKTETQKCYAEIQSFMRSILSIEIREAI
jgi:chromosome partitioning protein